jgi:hypothetical protein
VSKFGIAMRTLFSLFFLFDAFVVNKVIDSYISVQMAPSMMFSEGPEQRFGQDLMNLVGTVTWLVAIALAVLLMYPIAKAVFAKLNTKEDADEAA